MREIVRRGNKVVYDADDRFLKVFNPDKPVSDIFNEALNLARVNEAGVPSPQPLAVSQLPEFDNRWAFATTRLGGPTMQDVMDEKPGELDALLADFVDFQIAIHDHRAPLLPRAKDKYARMIKSLKGTLDASTRYELEMRLDGMPQASEVCHGDYNPSNVVIAPSGELYACDWAHATQGSGASDAAMTYLLFALEDEALAKKYLELYCERADTPRQVVHDWLPIVAAAELARHTGDNVEFLLSWISVADYQ
jgi:aminoglycoside phosphotransferase (APT) family kinase protein